MVYKTSRLESSLDYADKTQLATTTQRRFECSRIVLFRVLLDHRVRGTVTTAITKIPFVGCSIDSIMNPLIVECFVYIYVLDD